MKKVRSLSWIIPYLFSIYYLITGLWPLIHIHSFIYVSGPKTDIWLVKTVGLMITIVGLVILVASIRRKIPAELSWLAICFSAGLAFIDIFYVLKEEISPIYLLDAFAEILFIISWFIFLTGRKEIN